MEKKIRFVFSLLAIAIFAMASFAAAARTADPNLKPTFHKGFSAGLRPAPTQCVTDILARPGTPDFRRQVKEECVKVNPRKTFCVDFCVNKAERQARSVRTIALTSIPKAACNTPLKKVYATPEACLKERLRHCAGNCLRGRDQSFCSGEALYYCRRMGANPFKPVPIKK